MKVTEKMIKWATREDPNQFFKVDAAACEAIFQQVEDPWACSKEQLRHEHVAAFLRKYLPSPIPTPILDVGSGRGYSTEAMARLLEISHHLIWASDISPTAVQKGQEMLPLMNWFVWDITKPLPEGYAGTFHLVLVPEVLYIIPAEHIPAYTKNIVDALAPGGYLVVTEIVRSKRYSKGFLEYLKEVKYQSTKLEFPQGALNERIWMFQKENL